MSIYNTAVCVALNLFVQIFVYDMYNNKSIDGTFEAFINDYYHYYYSYYYKRTHETRNTKH